MPAPKSSNHLRNSHGKGRRRLLLQLREVVERRALLAAQDHRGRREVVPGVKPENVHPSDALWSPNNNAQSATASGRDDMWRLCLDLQIT